MRIFAFIFCTFIFFRTGNFIPLPFVLAGEASDFFQQLSVTGVINSQALKRSSIFLLGIIPYITAGIIFQLIKFSFAENAFFDKIYKKNSHSFYILLLSLIISVFQSLFFANSIFGELQLNFNFIVLTLSLVCGTFITIWFSKLITSFGFGNGASIIIVFSIIEFFYLNSFSILKNESYSSSLLFDLILQVFFIFALLFFISFVEPSYRPLRLVYPSNIKKHANNPGYFNNNNDSLPVKVNNSGVLPLIFALSLSSVMNIFFIPYVFNLFAIDLSIFVHILSIILIAFFVTLYTPHVFNVDDISNNLKKSMILCENRRPGQSTKKYISDVLSKMNILAVVYLSFIVSMPLLFELVFNQSLNLNGISCVIIVVVVLDILKRSQHKKYSHNFRSLLH